MEAPCVSAKTGLNMEQVFEAINNVFRFVTPVSDFFWDFPTNFEWYANIPILGNFSLAIILLIGSGIFFTCQLRFIQVRKFPYAMKTTLGRIFKKCCFITFLHRFLLDECCAICGLYCLYK